MKEFRVQCSWTITGEYLLKAETLGEAMEAAEGEVDFPSINNGYVDGSFEINSEVTMELNGRETQ